MILIEITDDTGVSYYEVLELDPEELVGIEVKEATNRVRKAGSEKKGKHNRAARLGDQAAEEKLSLINLAADTLKSEDKRKEYDEELLQGKGSVIEVLRVRRVGAPFFRDRLARFRVIEQVFRENGWTTPYAAGI